MKPSANSCLILLTCICTLHLSSLDAFPHYQKRINCGGDALLLDDGRFFDPDALYPGSDGSGALAGFTEGDWWLDGVLCGIRALLWWGSPPYNQILEGTLYATGRKAPGEYRFDLPSGHYAVTVHMSETEVHGTGLTAFNILVEGQPVAQNVDVYAEAGRFMAWKAGFHATVDDGQLNVAFVPRVPSMGNPQINAIEVLEIAPDSSPPAAPDRAFGIESYSLNGIFWNPNTEVDVAGYAVYRLRPDSGTFEKVHPGLLHVPYYLDYDVTPSASYTYRVTAVDIFENESLPTPDIHLHPHAIGESTLDVYQIQMDEEDLRTLDRNPFLDLYYPALFFWNGNLHGSTQVRYRGTVSRLADKKSWKVRFDPNNLFRGNRSLNLKAQFLSFNKIKEWLAFHLFESVRVPASRAEPIVLAVNGRFRGQFLDVENIDRYFLDRRGMDPNGNLYQVILSDLSLPDDPSLYDVYFEKETNPGGGHTDLQAFLETINLTPDEEFPAVLASVLNVPAFLEYYALQILISNHDFVAYNFRLYQNPADRRWLLIPWDLDYSFDPQDLAPIDYGTVENPQHGFHNVLIDRFLEVPQFRFAYCQTLRRLLATLFTPENIMPSVEAYFDRIAADVRRDVLKELKGWNDLFEWGPGTIAEYIEAQRSNLSGQLYDFMPALEDVLFINEFMADNKTTLADEYGEFDDWIEIYNAGYAPIDLEGMFLTDDPANTTKWRFPAVTLEPGSFLIVWADGTPSQGPLHTNFKLSASGECIEIYDLIENGHGLMDSVFFGPQTTDVSQARVPDGSPSWVFLTEPTPGRTNNPPPLVPPEILSVSHWPRLPRAQEQVTILATVTDDKNDVRNVWVYYDSGAGFVEAALEDDGLHGDGQPGDGVYGALLPGSPADTVVRYYIKAMDGDGLAAYYPTGAPGTSLAYAVGLPRIYVNEIMADNDHAFQDEAGEYDDWFELYNDEEGPVDLTGLFLTDNPSAPRKWPIPQVSIPAKGFLVFWADEQASQGPLHTNFKLSKSGEAVGLFASDAHANVPIDVVVFGEQYTDVSYGRYPDGAEAQRFFDVASPGGPNTTQDNCPDVINPDQYDGDGDGWGQACDCDDANPLVNPGRPEVPNNGIDDDCNPETPDEVPWVAAPASTAGDGGQGSRANAMLFHAALLAAVFFVTRLSLMRRQAPPGDR
jgi:spore coat protein CotH